MNPTPSPERPEPPEGYRLIPREYLEAGNVLPEDALFSGPGFGGWCKSGWRGRPIGEREDIADLFYATRTPAPEAVAGERCKKCHGEGWIFKDHGEDEQCDCIFADPPEATPPADKDAEIANLLPETFYSHLPAKDRVAFMVHGWQKAIIACRDQDSELTTLRAANKQLREALEKANKCINSLTLTLANKDRRECEDTRQGEYSKASQTGDLINQALASVKEETK